MKRLVRKFLALGIFSFVASPVFAAELAGVEMPDSVEVAGQSRVLNGQGMRLATFFKVKVYVAGLYVSHKTHDAETLLSDTDSKLMKMAMLRDLKAEQLQEALQEGFEKACSGEECEKYKEAIVQFAKLQPPVKKGELLEYAFLPEKVEVSHQGKSVGTVQAAGFSQVMIRVWLGKDPPNSELKKGLLGLNKK